jgi:V/A-type H+/Na+-transporting ATPase subunit D
MSRVRLTKIELKKQKDDLNRLKKYLPILSIKQRLLQKEIGRINEQLGMVRDSEKKIRENLFSWQAVFCENAEIEKKLTIAEIITETDNISGVDIPVLHSVVFKTEPYDLLTTPLWVDEAIYTLKELVQLRITASILVKQKQLLSEELKITSQRVNLFEKIKIPEAMAVINHIQVYLGDLETIAAGWARIAKKRI